MKQAVASPEELNELLDAIQECTGYDFHDFSPSTVERRLNYIQQSTGLSSYSEMIPLLFANESFRNRLLQSFSITVTRMFRNPLFFASLKNNVFPQLVNRAPFKIWHVGCATGEEVYSLAILLNEAHPGSDYQTYATDFNGQALEAAKEGIYSIPSIQKATRAYQESGGTASLSDYYYCQYGAVKMINDLKEKVIFSHYDLVNDRPFGKMDLIVCRNVMIYFNRSLQERVFAMFAECLTPGGYLCLGSKESLNLSAIRPMFNVVDVNEKIFKRK